jgi:hypothetical protein
MKSMSTKPNNPEVILPGKSYSLWADLKVNVWLLALWPTVFLGDLWLFNQEDSPFALRAVIALIPLALSLIWIRSVTRWIRGMDELHRRITQDACLFAITWTLFVMTAWQHLKHEQILDAVFLSSPSFLGRLVTGFNLAGLTEYDFYYAIVIILLAWFYFLGHFIFNRRYQ